jgi:cell division protein ZapA
MKEVSKEFTMTLRILSTVFPITIPREDEEMYRDAERLINERLNYYASQWPEVGPDRHLMMALLDLAVKQVKLNYRNDTEPYKQLMEGLRTEIEAILHPSK